jgi:hypothetical protein
MESMAARACEPGRGALAGGSAGPTWLLQVIDALSAWSSIHGSGEPSDGIVPTKSANKGRDCRRSRWREGRRPRRFPGMGRCRTLSQRTPVHYSARGSTCSGSRNVPRRPRPGLLPERRPGTARSQPSRHSEALSRVSAAQVRDGTSAQGGNCNASQRPAGKV